MRITRATIVGIIAGVLVLGGLVGFAVGLPKAEGLPKLPDTLGAQVFGLSTLTSEEVSGALGAQATQGADFDKLRTTTLASDKKAEQQLTDLYGDARYRTYLDLGHQDRLQAGSGPISIGVTVVATEPGLVFPQGPAAIDRGAGHYSLREIDGYQCAGTYQDAQPATSTTPASPELYGTSECRGERDGYTYDVYATMTSMDEAAAYLTAAMAG
ncbi:MAG TPA: hypothetical protein VN088_06105 [Nocardioides sp.]|nr:hypothetical protein [Nocardioides sp.]